jgi:hypothetical protein
MLKLMSSILTLLSTNTINHSHAQKINGRLPVTVSLLDPKTKAIIKQPFPAMRGYLRDINKTGLSLVMPSINCSDPFFICSGHILQVTLEFQNRNVDIQAFPVRYNIDESQDKYKYLIGAHILQIARSDRRYIDQYIKGSGHIMEAIRSLTHGLYDLFKNRINIRHNGMQLPLNISFLDSKANGTQTSIAMSGYLNDISKTGLSLIVPTNGFGNRYPIGDNYTLRIMIQIGGRTVNIQATPVRYNKLTENKGEPGYLIGARITVMNSLDRRYIVRYIKQLKKRKIAAAPIDVAHDVKHSGGRGLLKI